MSEETYPVKTRGLRTDELWTALMEYENRIATKTLPVGASYADLVAQVAPKDFGPAPPPELRRIISITGYYEDTPTGPIWMTTSFTVSPWPIDAENYPVDADEAEQRIIDDVVDLPTAKLALQKLARMIAHLYEQSMQ